MANRLKMAKIQAILTLHQRGWSYRRIAAELGIHRETVARHVLAHSKLAEAPPGSWSAYTRIAWRALEIVKQRIRARH